VKSAGASLSPQERRTPENNQKNENDSPTFHDFAQTHIEKFPDGAFCSMFFARWYLPIRSTIQAAKIN
jgi:hypothetical protein